MICSRCNNRPELRVCPQCRVNKKGNFTRNRFAEDVARKIFQEEAGSTLVGAQERAEEDVPEIRLPQYDEMGFPDHGLDRF